MSRRVRHAGRLPRARCDAFLASPDGAGGGSRSGASGGRSPGGTAGWAA